MINDTKQLIIKISDRFHADVKTLAIQKRTTVKQIVIEALVAYINNERAQNDNKRI